ncbi:MAG: hypothetical protein WCK05_05110, partial [Planctomycetota bacterium]
MTVNGRLELVRTIYWNKQRGTVAPLDQLLGLADDPDKAHTYAVGTSGDRVALGRLMRREAGKLRIDR